MKSIGKTIALLTGFGALIVLIYGIRNGGLNEEVARLDRIKFELMDDIKIRDDIISELKSEIAKHPKNEMVKWKPKPIVNNPVEDRKLEKHIKELGVLISAGYDLAKSDFKNHKSFQVYCDWRESGIREIELLDYLLQTLHLEEFKNATALSESNYPMAKQRVEKGIYILIKVQTFLQIKK